MGLLSKLNEWADKKWAQVNKSIPEASFFSIDIGGAGPQSNANWSTYYEDLNVTPKALVTPKSLVSAEWDLSNAHHNPGEVSDNSEWIIGLYKNILNIDVDSYDHGYQYWMKRLETDMSRPQVLDYFRSVALKENTESNKVDFGDITRKPKDLASPKDLVSPRVDTKD